MAARDQGPSHCVAVGLAATAEGTERAAEDGPSKAGGVEADEAARRCSDSSAAFVGWEAGTSCSWEVAEWSDCEGAASAIEMRPTRSNGGPSSAQTGRPNGAVSWAAPMVDAVGRPDDHRVLVRWCSRAGKAAVKEVDNPGRAVSDAAVRGADPSFAFVNDGPTVLARHVRDDSSQGSPDVLRQLVHPDEWVLVRPATFGGASAAGAERGTCQAVLAAAAAARPS